MSETMQAHIEAIQSRGSISAEDVLTLRREVFPDGVVCRNEAEALFRLNDASLEAAPEWAEFFVEALMDHIVYQKEPRGYVEEQDAAWLIERVSHDGCVETMAELELLIRVMEKAYATPESLHCFVLAQVRQAVVLGHGALVRDKVLTPGVVGKAEVELLRRILFAPGSEGVVAISRQEAETLFDIAEDTADANNHADWYEMFCKAIANYLLAANKMTVPSREEVFASHQWLNSDEGINWSGAFDRTAVASEFKTGLGSLFSGIFGGKSHMEKIHEERNAQHAREADIAAKIDTVEANWILERIHKDGRFSDIERALLSFLSERADLPESLRAYLDKADHSIIVQSGAA
jgi:hypothetical protein